MNPKTVYIISLGLYSLWLHYNETILFEPLYDFINYVKWWYGIKLSYFDANNNIGQSIFIIYGSWILSILN